MEKPPSAARRRELIVELASRTGLASVEELAEQFGISPSTIRRDLARLHADGRLARTYGGAIPAVAHPESSLRERLQESTAQKTAVSARAAELIDDGEVLLFDGGSTVLQLAHAVHDRGPLTVVTAALHTMQALSSAPGVVVECLGGRLRTMSDSMVGPIAEAALERMTFDKVFLGADGVDAQRGICEADREQARLKELMVRASDEVVVLADSSKLGIAPFHAWTRLGEDWTLITDDGATNKQLLPFSDAGVHVIIAAAATINPDTD
ncbi:DeoR/GlpR family DNA-binding transcription regulator [Glycomyces sp. TRM65418]|uniref:DeoR/GlpR family DNA-binding transcription regulator n=1 Tax=Glycomyces sp. TRM65418 TaxID=2867006 RepID=UPI001CE6F93D|nr:DeoR/GlpR family DNA-binding transcription regulator [Glycomyces sp. TRM65418]MCC3764472.1 DeoR/GlpR family DNA-binding transcription regulator [Glycomyces sp. TRM65418]QZD54145.1 DeoR/GlpR family DNA-binding transcription regulator [Glycomyces sp. TRM65418]